jgi:chemotaxis signal transduction protein
MSTHADVLAMLRLRAQKLAQAVAADEAMATTPYVAFALGGHGLAVPLAAMLHAGRLRHLTAVPGADACLLGVTALGGHVVSVVDAAVLLQLPRRGLSDITSCLVVGHAGRKLGLGADQLLGIEDLPASCIKRFPAGGDAAPQIALRRDRQLLLLDLPQVFTDPRLGPE